jgi:hypothetical protein
VTVDSNERTSADAPPAVDVLMGHEIFTDTPGYLRACRHCQSPRHVRADCKTWQAIKRSPERLVNYENALLADNRRDVLQATAVQQQQQRHQKLAAEQKKRDQQLEKKKQQEEEAERKRQQAAAIESDWQGFLACEREPESWSVEAVKADPVVQRSALAFLAKRAIARHDYEAEEDFEAGLSERMTEYGDYLSDTVSAPSVANLTIRVRNTRLEWLESRLGLDDSQEAAASDHDEEMDDANGASTPQQ